MRNVTGATVDRPVNQLKWMDAQTIALTVARGFRTAIEIVAVGDGRAETIAGLAGNVSTYARTPDGTVVFVSETATRAPELWIKTPGAAARVVTTFNERWSSRTIVAPEFVKYTSADGTEIEAALLQPSALSPKP